MLEALGYSTPRRPIRKDATLGIVGIGCELHREGPARSDNPQVFVENDQRFTNGVHHCLRKRTSIFDLAELPLELNLLTRRASPK